MQPRVHGPSFQSRNLDLGPHLLHSLINNYWMSFLFSFAWILNIFFYSQSIANLISLIYYILGLFKFIFNIKVFFTHFQFLVFLDSEVDANMRPTYVTRKRVAEYWHLFMHVKIILI